MRERRLSELTHSYLLCQRLARQAHSSFYYCFYLLPRRKRQAMYALYAFLRRADDIGDDPPDESEGRLQAQGPTDAGVRLASLARLRGALDAALGGEFDDPLFPALADTVKQFAIPRKYLDAVLDGVQMDLEQATYATFADLQQYCYRVASVVGQACIHIWGFRGDRAIELAAQCGLAFQLTNILRDLHEDSMRGRVYLPSTELSHFGYSADELRRGVRDERFRMLVRFQVERAESFFRSAAALAPYFHADGQRIYRAMFGTYHQLLRKVDRSYEAGSVERVRLVFWEKLRMATEALLLPLDPMYRRASSGPSLP
jgi:phytoene synthase